MKKNASLLDPALIILAAVFWGSMGLFVRPLSARGFSSLQITSARLTFGALVFCGFLLLRKNLKMRLSCQKCL